MSDLKLEQCKKLGHWKEGRKGGWMDGWMDGWKVGWVDGKAGLRIAYSNKKST